MRTVFEVIASALVSLAESVYLQSLPAKRLAHQWV
jgi:hypothetical protein